VMLTVSIEDLVASGVTPNADRSSCR